MYTVLDEKVVCNFLGKFVNSFVLSSGSNLPMENELSHWVKEIWIHKFIPEITDNFFVRDRVFEAK